MNELLSSVRVESHVPSPDDEVGGKEGDHRFRTEHLGAKDVAGNRPVVMQIHGQQFPL